MSEKDLEQLKKEAAQKAKEAAMRKLAEKKAQEEKASSASNQDDNDVKDTESAKASTEVAEAAAKTEASADEKAKAAAAAAAKAKGIEASDDEKAKAAAAAKAKAAAFAKAKAAAKAKGIEASDDEKAKAIAAAKAKAAAFAKAKAMGEAQAEASEEEQKPSVNQPYLDKYLKVIEEHLGKDVLEEAYINRLSKDVPTLVIAKEAYIKVAEFLKYNEQLGFDYLSETHGTDFETHFEIYTHLYSYKNKQSVAIKVKVDRNNPQIDSLTPLWPGANWPEREAYDLLGIEFINHPNLTRILLPDEWVGHPLRKDYEPYDVEV